MHHQEILIGYNQIEILPINIVKMGNTIRKGCKPIYKPIDGYNGLYEVSNMGDIRSLQKRHGLEGKILKPSKNSIGYSTVVLCCGGIKTRYTIHRLVAKAFISNPKHKPQVNHKNGDKHDNRINNLERVTKSENKIHSIYSLGKNTSTNLGIYIQKGKNNPNNKKIIQYSLDGLKIKERCSSMDIKRNIGYTSQSITKCCRGKSKTAYGFIWKYI